MQITFIWGADSDIKTSLFLELLLKYGYVWIQNNENMKLNLPEIMKKQFLLECKNSIEYLDELTASIKIELIKNCFTEEYTRIRNGLKNPEEPILPWYFLACQLFQEAVISEPTKNSSSIIVNASDSLSAIASGLVTVSAENASVTNSRTPLVTVTSNTPDVRIPILQITEAPTLTTASSLPSKSVAQPASATSLATNRKLPYYSEIKGSTNSYVTSTKNIYQSETYSKKAKIQYDFPIKYPFCILSAASLGGSMDELDIPNPQYEGVSLSKYKMPVLQPDKSHPQTSDFSIISENNRISSFTNNITHQNKMPLKTKCEDFSGKYSSPQFFQSSSIKALVSSHSSENDFLASNPNEAQFSASNVSKVEFSASNPNKVNFSASEPNKENLSNTRIKFSSSFRTEIQPSNLLAEKTSLLPPISISFFSSIGSSASAFTSVSSPVVSRISNMQVNKKPSPLISKNSSLPVSKRGPSLKSSTKVTNMTHFASDKLPDSIPTLLETEASTLTVASCLPLTAVVQPVSRTNLLPHWELAYTSNTTPDNISTLSATEALALTTASLPSSSVVKQASWTTQLPHWKKKLRSDPQPISIPILPITGAPTLTTNPLPSTSIVQPLPGTIQLSHWKLPPVDKNFKKSKHSSTSSPSAKNMHPNEITSSKMKPQYYFPVKYPFCILPEASLANVIDSPSIACSDYEIGPLSGNKIPDAQTAPLSIQNSGVTIYTKQ